MKGNKKEVIESRKYISPRVQQLIETGKFTSAYAKSFLKTTYLPDDLLILCVEHLTRSVCKRHNNRIERRKGCLNIISNTQLNRICQVERIPSPSFLLDQIQAERKIRKKYYLVAKQLIDWHEHFHLVPFNSKTKLYPFWGSCHSLVAKKLIDWNKPVIWKAFSKTKLFRFIGICPNTHCNTLRFKSLGPNLRDSGIRDSGRNLRDCPRCHSRFQWCRAQLDPNGVVETCSTISSDRSEYFFCQRILKLAEQVVCLTIQSSSDKRKGKRPILKTDNQDIPESFQYQGQSFCFLDCEDSFDDNDLEYCELSPSILPHDKVSREVDESSSPVDCPRSRSTENSHHEYVVVSDRDGSFSTTCEESDWEESSSFSVISGCETVHSLDDPHGTEEGTLAMLTYCKAVKLGISVAKKEKVQSTEEIPSSVSILTLTTSPISPHEKSWITVKSNHLPNNTSEKASARLSPCQNVYCSHKNANEEKHDADHCGNEEDDVFLSIYDGAKSGHGGRSSLLFRGNDRTQRSSRHGWGNQRRPNWSRKRRKEYKNNKFYT